MTLFIVDGSSFQRDINWPVVQAQGISAGWEKVTQGRNYANPYWADAKDQMVPMSGGSNPGFVGGGYLFVEEGDGAGQAEWFAEHAGDMTGLGIAVDIEPSGSSRPGWADGDACVTRLRHLYPEHAECIGGYIPPWYWGNTDTTFVNWLWASRYLTGFGSPQALYPHVPASWWSGYGGRGVDLLQFTSTGVVAGVAGTVDCSAYGGSLSAYAGMVLPGGSPPPPPGSPDKWQVDMMNRLPTLRQGGGHPVFVRKAQALLGPAGAKVTEDGKFGPDTDTAVRHVQAAHFGAAGTDGVIGPDTWAVLVTGQA